MNSRSGAGRLLTLLLALTATGLLATPAMAAGRAGRPDPPVDPHLERTIARQLARLDERLGLDTFPDGTGHWTARLAAALEYRLRHPDGSGVFSPNLIARLADELRRLGVERPLDPPPVRPGVASTPEPPGRERVARLQDILATVRLLQGKLDRVDGIEERAARIAPRVVPANDDCSAAIVIGEGTVSGATSGATADGSSACSDPYTAPDVWYRYTAAEDGPVSFDTFGSSYDTLLSIHDGCPGSGRNTELACNDDSTGTVQSQLSIDMTVDEEVWVRVSGFGGASGAFDLTVSPNHGIEGTITRADTGAVLAGATVNLYDVLGLYENTRVTGADGTYSFAGLSDGTYFILAASDGLVAELYDDVACPSYSYCSPEYFGTPVTVSGGVTSGIDLALNPAGAIEGTITDASTGDPLRSFVDLYSSAGNYLDSVYSDPDGTYSFGDLPAGKYYLSASATGYPAELYDDIPCGGSCDVLTGTQVPVVIGGRVSGIDFALDHLGALSGTVTEEGTGDPIQGARVEVYSSTGSYTGFAYTNSAGTYLRQNLAAGNYYVLTETSSYSDELYDDMPCEAGCTATTGTPVAVSLASTTTGIDFSLVAYGKVTGRVTEAITGVPLTGGNVYVFDTSGSGVQGAAPAVDGTYEISVPPGMHFIGTASYYDHRDETWDDLACEPGPCDRTSGTPIEVAATETLPGIDFVLDRWGVVEGTAKAEDTGSGLYGDLVILDTAGNYVSSDFDFGTYSVDRLAPGTYYVKYVSGDYFGTDYQDELFDDVPCEPSCDLSLGTPITVTLNGKLTGLDFVLTACPADTYNHLVGTSFYGTATEQACETLTAGDLTIVSSTGDVTFEAGRSIVLGDGFAVLSGGRFRAVIEPSWAHDQ